MSRRRRFDAGLLCAAGRPHHDESLRVESPNQICVSDSVSPFGRSLAKGTMHTRSIDQTGKEFQTWFLFYLVFTWFYPISWMKCFEKSNSFMIKSLRQNFSWFNQSTRPFFIEKGFVFSLIVLEFCKIFLHGYCFTGFIPSFNVFYGDSALFSACQIAPPSTS